MEPEEEIKRQWGGSLPRKVAESLTAEKEAVPTPVGRSGGAQPRELPNLRARGRGPQKAFKIQLNHFLPLWLPGMGLDLVHCGG